MLAEKLCPIINERGLHARAAAQFVKQASRYSAEIWVEKDRRRVNGKSIMGILTLAAARGSKIKISAKGLDAGSAVETLSQLVAAGFYEEQSQ